MKMTEADVQRAIAKTPEFQKRYDILVPNCYTMYDNEADLFGLRPSGLCDEIEIKVSRADFKVDAKKSVRVSIKLDKPINYRTHKFVRFTKREALEMGHMSNYFWYAVPDQLIKPDEVPEWAGLIYIHSDGYARVVKSAKRLHKHPLHPAECYKTARKMNYKYWNKVLA
ncbi:hypothetical protein phiAS5_ORF0162 [Aeromonas phage phiAS5]|uniref:Uncharacterized protein n=1 Tax=Aeromonas phage phiAS5 TaxID=879630 RepID=E1A2Q9_9CAUD|nr:hypothetical protein phiAS5_ORF0162 [Aeromonas phage phiAS5]ADM80005.1 hypothetical protein phiAS5_ORF0162 [Aeromonas phage phiAS5]